MDAPSLVSLIQRCLNGQATTDEVQWLREHWQQSLQNDEVLRQLSNSNREALRRRMYEGVLGRIQAQEPGAFGERVTNDPVWRDPVWRDPVVRSLSSQRRWRWAAAASVAALLLMVGGWWFWIKPAASDTLAYQTAYGETHQIALPDGSTVWLNGNSVLRYNMDAPTGIRHAYLRGEALFRVRHTATHQRFVVHTAQRLNVEVLGTVFSVTDRRGLVRVMLRSGSVRVTDRLRQQSDILLRPGQVVSQHNNNTPQIATSRAAQSPNGSSDFTYVENKPLGDVFDWMEDTYGLTIVCEQPALRQETFAGSVPTDSIGQFFQKLEKLYPVQVSRQGSVYRLR